MTSKQKTLCSLPTELLRRILEHLLLNWTVSVHGDSGKTRKFARPTIWINYRMPQQPRGKEPIEYGELLANNRDVDTSILCVNKKLSSIGSMLLYGNNHVRLSSFYPESAPYPFVRNIQARNTLCVRSLGLDIGDFYRNPSPSLVSCALQLITEYFANATKLHLSMDADAFNASRRNPPIFCIAKQAYLLLLAAFVTLRHENLKTATWSQKLHDKYRHVARMKIHVEVVSPGRTPCDPEAHILNCSKIRHLRYEGLYDSNLQIGRDLTIDPANQTPESETAMSEGLPGSTGLSFNAEDDLDLWKMFE